MRGRCRGREVQEPCGQGRKLSPGLAWYAASRLPRRTRILRTSRRFQESLRGCRRHGIGDVLRRQGAGAAHGREVRSGAVSKRLPHIRVRLHTRAVVRPPREGLERCGDSRQSRRLRRCVLRGGTRRVSGAPHPEARRRGGDSRRPQQVLDDDGGMDARRA